MCFIYLPPSKIQIVWRNMIAVAGAFQGAIDDGF
jgi:hypothetical protein